MTRTRWTNLPQLKYNIKNGTTPSAKGMTPYFISDSAKRLYNHPEQVDYITAFGKMHHKIRNSTGVIHTAALRSLLRIIPQNQFADNSNNY